MGVLAALIERGRTGRGQFVQSALFAVGVFAGIVVLSVFVVVLDALVDRLERRLLVWRPAPRMDAH